MNQSSTDKKKSSGMASANTVNQGAPPLPEEKSQRFIKNSQYFTICIYGIVMVLLSAIIFKSIIDIEKTKAWLGQIFAMLSPFIFGALLAYVLNPMVHMFYRWIDKLCTRMKIRIKHSVHTVLSILITYVIVFGFVILTLVFVLPEIAKNIIDFVNYIPNAYNTVMRWLQQLQERFPSLEIELITKPLSEAMPELVSTLQSFATDMLPALYTISMSIAEWVLNLLITVIVSIYMLYDKRRMMRASWKIIYAFLPEKYIPACKEILAECNRLFSSFVVGKFIDSLLIGILCFILMTILRLPYALMISLIIGITNMIPYFGPFIGAIPSILILLFINPLDALAFAIMILCLQQFDGLILGPKILGGSIGLKPLWIIFGITVGGSIAGIIGMFLGVPLVAFINYLIDLYLDHRLKKKKISEDTIDGALKNIELDD
jgi:predicted PurR-regulated permease PerM